MRILYHHRTRAQDAQGIHIREIVRALESLGHEVKVVSLVNIEQDDNQDHQQSGKTGNTGANWRNAYLYEIMAIAYNVYGLAMLLFAGLRFKPDMIYERYSLYTFCGYLLSKIFRIPLVLEVNAPLSYEKKKYEKIAFPNLALVMERWICSSATQTIVVSNVMKDMLCKIGVPRDRMVVIHNGIDPEVFHPNVPCDDIRRKWGLDGNAVLGFIGWFKHWHGLENLVELYAEEGWKSEHVKLFLVGDGPARMEIEKIAEQHGVSPNLAITSTVPRKKIPAHISAMDIALQPAAPEYASPIKIFEYMGMGKCIVAPDQPNIREIIEDGRTGLLFKPGSKEDMGKALRRAISDPDLRKALGRNARQEVFNKRYLWRNNAERAIRLVFPAQESVGREGGR